MKPHFSSLISACPRMEFQLELLIRSLEFFGKCYDYFFDLYVLEGEVIKSDFINKKVNIITYQASKDVDFILPWRVCPIWNVEPKSEIRIHFDSDLLITSNINEIFDYCSSPGFYGAIANVPPFSLSDWEVALKMFNLTLPDKMYMYKKCCGDIHGDKDHSVCPFYSNMGVSIMYSQYVPQMRETMKHVLKTLNEKYRDNYYLPQIATSISLQLLNIPRFLLPNKYNHIIGFKYKTPLLGTDEPIICHYPHSATNINDLKLNKFVYNCAKQLITYKIYN